MRLMSRAKTLLLAAGVVAALLAGAAQAQLPAPAQQDLQSAIRNAQPPQAPAQPSPLLPPPSSAPAASAEAPSPIAEAATRIIQRVGPVSERRGLETIMTVSLRDADLAQSVRLIAEEAGVNVVLGKDVAGRVTCNGTN